MRIFPVLTALVFAACIAPAAAQYATGFEAPTYADASPVAGVDGWTQTGGDPDQAIIQTTAVHSGQQALLLQQPPAGGTKSVTLLHTFPSFSSGVLKIEVWLAPFDPGTDATGTWFTVEEGSSSSKRSALFGFRSGVIAYNNGASWTNSTTTYVPGDWYKFTSLIDYSTRTWSLLINDSPFAANLGFWHAAHTAATNVRIYKGGNNTGMAVDDLQVVPEPASFVALAMGVAGLAGALRRR